MECLLIFFELADLFFSAILFSYRFFIKLAVQAVFQLLDNRATLLPKVFPTLFVRNSCQIDLNLVLHTFLHVLDFVVGFFRNSRHFFTLLML